ncbi:hypothetical protein ABG768_018572 [Culter alburnus]|uniref:Uncharacterized protein n=1 Tax=Culter alburnus TaxID=194366 RepID=A0AAW1YXS8_CULAL
MELNKLSDVVTGQAKYPALLVSQTDTRERFGLQYVEPGCRPVPLDWDKHKSQKVPVAGEGEHQSSEPSAFSERFPPDDPPEEVREEHFAQDDIFGVASLGSQTMIQPAQPTKVKDEMAPPLPFVPSPRAARTGPIKTGGLLFVLDHFRWTQPMRDSIDGLLAKYHGQKDLLSQVDAEYAALVQAASKDPNSLLHPTTKQHISRYVKHLAKMTNTSSSLNTSSEKLQETQQLWHHLTEGSETASVPVVTLPPAPVNPPRNKPQESPLTKREIEQMVKEIVEKQQQHQQQPVTKRTRNCLACGQPKSRYLGDGTSIHFFLSQKASPILECRLLTLLKHLFFNRELQAAKQRSAEAREVMEERKKRKAMEQHPTGRLCRFCHKPLKQGPQSPHIHARFPGVAGKYVYCPARVFSLYRTEGMTHEMTWGEFCQSSFYEAERKRWAAEKGK